MIVESEKNLWASRRRQGLEVDVDGDLESADVCRMHLGGQNGFNEDEAVGLQ